MKPFERLVGVAAPLFRANIDTDTIIPSPLITSASRLGYGPKLMAAWRYDPDGAERADFILNREPWRQSRILIGGENFGCGSSREMAVWALSQFGIRCVIAPSFAPIFRQNWLRNGLLPLVLPSEQVRALAELAQAQPNDWAVELEGCSLTDPSGRVHRFDIDPVEREQLLKGLDPIGVTLQREAQIRAFVQQDRQRRPWIWGGAA